MIDSIDAKNARALRDKYGLNNMLEKCYAAIRKKAKDGYSEASVKCPNYFLETVTKTESDICLIDGPLIRALEDEKFLVYICGDKKPIETKIHIDWSGDKVLEAKAAESDLEDHIWSPRE